MPKTTAPLLSFDARGQIAKSMVYSSWRGRPYVRRYAIPNNPQTVAQTDVRAVFSMLNKAWLFGTTDVTAPWDAYATGRPFLGRNAFIGQNAKALDGPPVEANIADFVFSPGAKGGLPASNLVLTPSGTQISAAFVAPATPAGWTLTKGVLAALPNIDPTLPFGGKWYVATETPPSTPIVVTGLVAATAYVVGLWLIWTKPDGSLAYSISISGTATTP